MHRKIRNTYGIEQSGHVYPNIGGDMGNAREIKKISLKVLAIFTIAIALFALLADGISIGDDSPSGP